MIDHILAIESSSLDHVA